MNHQITGTKIVVVGPNGSGKTTFAKKLSQILQIPHIELDNIYWKADWGESDNEEFRQKVNVETEKARWIIDGNYARNQDLTLPRADTIIWLDVSITKSAYRTIKRSLNRIITKEPLWHNNRETIRKLFSGDSIVLFGIKTHKNKTKRYNELIARNEYRHINWVRIRNSNEEKEFWRNLIT